MGAKKNIWKYGLMYIFWLLQMEKIPT